MEKTYKQPREFTERDFIESIIAVYGECCEFTSAQASEYALPWYCYSAWRCRAPFAIHGTGAYPRHEQFFNNYSKAHNLRSLFNCREEVHTIEGKFYHSTSKWYNPLIDVETYSEDKPAGKGWELVEDGKKPLQYIVKYWSLKDAKAAIELIEKREAKHKEEQRYRAERTISQAVDKVRAAGFSIDEIKAMI